MGQKYASYNASGAVIAYYDSVDSPPPSTATTIAITNSQWLAAIASPYPVTVADGALVIPTGPTLAFAQAAQSALIKQGFANANAANISFTTAAGVTDTYQCDPKSLQAIQTYLSGFQAAGAVPSGFYWRSATNQNNAFTYADLEKLSQAIAARGFANYNQLQTLIAKVKAAKKVSAVQAVVWVNP